METDFASPASQNSQEGAFDPFGMSEPQADAAPQPEQAADQFDPMGALEQDAAEQPMEQPAEQLSEPPAEEPAAQEPQEPQEQPQDAPAPEGAAEGQGLDDLLAGGDAPAEQAPPEADTEAEPEAEPEEQKEEERDLIKVDSDAVMANEVTAAQADTTIYDANMVKYEEFKERQDVEQATARDMQEADAAEQRRTFLETFMSNAEKRKADQITARKEIKECLADDGKTSWKKVRTLMRENAHMGETADRQESVIKHKVAHEDEVAAEKAEKEKEDKKEEKEEEKKEEEKKED